MNLAAIFQGLDHLNDFEIFGYGGHFVLQNKANIFLSKTFAGQDFSWFVFTF